MSVFQKDGPKRRRRTRRDWSGVGGYGQVRRWGSTTIHFKRTREAKRARAERRANAV